jgi:hypothetical protein
MFQIESNIKMELKQLTEETTILLFEVIYFLCVLFFFFYLIYKLKYNILINLRQVILKNRCQNLE